MEIGGERAIGELGDGTCHLHAGGTAADDHEGKKAPTLGRIGLGFRTFECQQDAPPQIGGIVDSLETRRIRCPIVVTKVCVLRSCGENEKIKRDAAAFRNHFAGGRVDARNRGENHRDILLRSEDTTDRCGNIRRRKACRRNLIEQRLEQMIIVPIDQADFEG